MTETKTEFKTFLNCLIAMAASDGVLHEKEVDVILDILHKIIGLGIKRKNIYDAYKNFEHSEKKSAYEILEDSEEKIGDDIKEFIIKASYLIMISDGKVVDHETGQLSEIAALLDVEEDKFAQLIREAAQIS